MHELQLLNTRLDVLLKKYALLHSENKKLRITIAEQTKNMATLNVKLSDLEQNMIAVQIGRSVSYDEKQKMRRQLDTVIGEIDKILAKLND
ncbi:MAG TPA: hypothetical protein PL009_13080 [Flavipsychrobacter sp.]|mgnify:CR=1 FL=1|nr:hypothetical protein [Flavipsychrobacter sp.]